jgi:large subunit ribosomal protein L25
MSHILNAKLRELKGRKTSILRAQGQIPAIVYGVGTQPVSISVDRNFFLKTYKQAGESTIVELSVEEKTPLHVLIQDFQTDPLLNNVTHVDFRAIDMNKEIETDVELEIVGEAPAVKTLGGTLVLSRDYVTVRCLPKFLIRTLKVDISKLEIFEDGINIEDLEVPDGITILDEPGLSIAIVEAPRSEEELAALEGAVEEDVSEVEVAGKKEETEDQDGQVKTEESPETHDKK